ncbi:MAG: hypothetical protein V9G98_19265 [Candidatus Competibacter sp.]
MLQATVPILGQDIVEGRFGDIQRDIGTDPLPWFGGRRRFHAKQVSAGWHNVGQRFFERRLD